MTRHTVLSVFVVLSAILIGCSAGESQKPDQVQSMESAVPAGSPDQPTETTIGDSDRFLLHSEEIGQTYVIDVAMPRRPSEGKMPVVYVTDGGMAPLVVVASRMMELGHELPPMIVVGIIHKVEKPLDIIALRIRDLTPTVDEAFVAAQAGGWMELPEGQSPGGADAFLDFIEEQVKPMVRENYPASDDETLVGDSAGGLFALYAMFNRTEDYDRYLAGSPAISWDEGMLFNEEVAYADANDDLDVDLFLSVGALESERMVGNMAKMAERLRSRGYPNLRLTEHVFEGETHLSVVPATLSRGLRALFAPEAAELQAALERQTD